VRYYPRATLAGLFRQMVRYGRGRVRLLRKHPDTFSLPGFAPAAFLGGVVGGSLLAWWLQPLTWAYLGALGSYALVVLLFSLAIGLRRRAPALMPLLPLVFAAIHFGAGTGLWLETIAGRRRQRREETLPARPIAPRRAA
jgi:hypothetical protein